MTTKIRPHHSPIRGFIFHLHPRKVVAETIRFTLSFGLGGKANKLFVDLVLKDLIQHKRD